MKLSNTDSNLVNAETPKSALSAVDMPKSSSLSLVWWLTESNPAPFLVQ